MSAVDQLLAERRRSVYRIRFSGDLEDSYRTNLRRQLRIPRMIFFLVAATAFAIAPMQDATLFMPPPELQGVSSLIAWLVCPVCLAAAYVSWTPEQRPSLTRGIQSAAVLTIFSAVLGLRHLALTSSFQYPASMLGIVITSVAIFGSFSAYRVIPTMLLFYGIGIGQEVHYARLNLGTELPIYVLAYHAMISFFGAYTNEILRRQSWLQGKTASVLGRTDVLTGLPNRASFNKRWSQAFAQAQRERKVLALMTLDLDHFKALNDRLGHQAGDAALRLVGQILPAAVGQRPLDLHARVGGEEFMVVWYDVDPDSVQRLVDTVLDAIRKAELLLPGQTQPCRMTASAGLTWGIPQGNASEDQWLGRADALMYRAKNSGRDRAVIEPF